MAVTLLDVVNRIRRNVGLDPTITAFSDDDESNDNVQDVNESYEDLLQVLPKGIPYLNKSASLSLVNGTRLYSIATDAHGFNLYSWSFQNETDEDEPLIFTTLEYIQALTPKYDETTGKPKYVYLEGNDQVGFYPIPDGARTVDYKYGQSLTARLSSTSATFIIPDPWVRVVEKMAQERYERRKGYASANRTFNDALNLLGEVLSEAWEMEPTYLQGEHIQ